MVNPIKKVLSIRIINGIRHLELLGGPSEKNTLYHEWREVLIDCHLFFTDKIFGSEILHQKLQGTPNKYYIHIYHCRAEVMIGE